MFHCPLGLPRPRSFVEGSRVLAGDVGSHCPRKLPVHQRDGAMGSSQKWTAWTTWQGLGTRHCIQQVLSTCWISEPEPSFSFHEGVCPPGLRVRALLAVLGGWEGPRVPCSRHVWAPGSTKGPLVEADSATGPAPARGKTPWLHLRVHVPPASTHRPREPPPALLGPRCVTVRDDARVPRSSQEQRSRKGRSAERPDEGPGRELWGRGLEPTRTGPRRLDFGCASN